MHEEDGDRKGDEEFDDLTPLQQKQKYAAWAKFKEARAQGLKTRWEAEKLYIKEDEKWVVHLVCATC